MVEFDVPGTEQDLDTDDGVSGVAMALISLVGGATVLFAAMGVGQQFAGRLLSGLAEMFGTQVGDADPGITFGD